MLLLYPCTAAASRFYRGEMDNFPATPVYPIALVSRKAAAFASDPGTVYYTALDNTVRKVRLTPQLRQQLA